MRRFLARIGILAIPVFASASAMADGLTDLFASTCMKNFYAQDKLRAEMNASGASVVPPEKAGLFLNDRPGTAWLLMGSSTAYVVALRNDTSCAVFAQKADAARVRAAFIELVGSAPEPMSAEEQDGSTLGPDNEHARTTAYTWSRPEDAGELLFVLTSSDSPEASAQAMVSMALVSKIKGAK